MSIQVLKRPLCVAGGHRMGGHLPVCYLPRRVLGIGSEGLLRS